mgnify:CR=1 FL=1
MSVKPLQFLPWFVLVMASCLHAPLSAQIHDPVTWDFSMYDNGDGTVDLDFHATVDDGWHVYSQKLDPFDGPIPTSFLIETEGVLTADSMAAECEPHLEYDPNFMLDLLFFEKGSKTKDIWYYEHNLPEGQKSYSKTKAIQFNEFQPIIDWWNNREENDQAWKVSINDLIDWNLILNRLIITFEMNLEEFC